MTFILFFSLAYTAAVILLVYEKLFARGKAIGAPLSLLLCYTTTVALSVCFVPFDLQLFLALATSGAGLWLTRRWFADFNPSGQLLLVNYGLFSVFGAFWGLWFITGLSVSLLTKSLMFTGNLLLLVTLPVGLTQALETWEILCRKRWSRHGRIQPPVALSRYPKVSLHVPTYAEPPELVIATLDTLAALDYPNFEILVIDNNTKDPSLWQPVEAHCRQLGERFRFFHIDSLSGAKAGALNFALRHTGFDVEIVGVVDADYQVQSDFLSKLVGYFDDPRIGFVQTPHDYREWKDNIYLRWCYWEYKLFFATKMVSMDERDTALCVGTMCLIRHTALQEVGGWSEWCQTEDSELAIRVHAAGYSSIYIPLSFGWGLIPESFDGYKRQRYRWAYGPVQEVMHHLKLFIPGPWSRASGLTPRQKLHHLNHGLSHFFNGLGILLTPIGMATIISMSVLREGRSISFPVGIVFATAFCNDWALKILIYCKEMNCSLLDAIGAIVAKQSLGYATLMASIAASFNFKTVWMRTSKFKVLPNQLIALQSAQIELILSLLTFACVFFVIAASSMSGLLLVLVVGLLLQGWTYLSSPLLAMLADQENSVSLCSQHNKAEW